MTKQDRTTLKSFFRNGALPTADHYGDLIDSSVNQVEDGYSKTAVDGLKLNSVGSSLRLLSLYQGLGTPKPSWVVEHGNSPGTLHIRPDLGKQALEIDPDAKANPGDGKPEPAKSFFRSSRTPSHADAETGADVVETPVATGFCLTRDGRVGINRDAPDWRLDIAGVARMEGRIGTTSHKIPDVPANGKWHDITHPMTGCQAFEVMAGAGGERYDGHYSMLHAIAMNAFHPRNPILNWVFGRRAIRAQTAMYGSYADRIRLRWLATEERHHFKLQLRTNANFGEGKVVRYYLTRLWFDSVMAGSRDEGDRDKGRL